jgi:hypothetical protein
MSPKGRRRDRSSELEMEGLGSVRRNSRVIGGVGGDLGIESKPEDLDVFLK